MASFFEISFRLDAAVTNSFAGSFNKAGISIAQLQQQAAKLQQQSGQIQAFQRIKNSVGQTSEQYRSAQNRVRELARQMHSTTTPTRTLANEFTKAKNEAAKLKEKLQNQSQELQRNRSALREAGYDTNRLSVEHKNLQQQINRTTEAHDRLKQAQERLASARQKLSWDSIKSDFMASAGFMYTLKAPVQVSMDFEAAMARVNAVAFSGAGRNKTQDAKDFELLQKQARDLGASRQFTAVQAANAQENLARAGFKANEIISAMPGLLNMAAAEGMDLAQAADIASGALRGFNLDAENMDRVANILAQTSAASNTSIIELGEAMKYVAPVASGLGISIEQTNAMLGAMANNAIKGSQAGTSLRAALLRLSKEPAAVAKALNELGIKATDTQGRLREMPELMQALSKRMSGMGEAKQMQYLSNIFGAEASAGMLAIMKESVSGTLQQLEFFNKASDGVMKQILEHVNKGVENSVVSFEEMQKGMENSSYYAESLGISFNDLAVDLALLARSGIKGADADKGLTAAFKQLKEQPAKVQKALKQLNISMAGSNGEVKDFITLIQEVKQQVMSLDQTKRLDFIEQIFGKGSGATIQALMKTMTDETLAGYKNAIKQAQSISSEMSGKNQATLAGQLTALSSAWEGFLEKIGTSLEPAIKPFVSGLTKILGLVNEALEACPLFTTAIVDLFAAFAGYKVLKTFYTTGKSIAALIGAWNTLTLAQAAATGTATTAQWSLNAAMSANPVGALIVGIGALIGVGYLLYKNWDKIKELGVKMWGWIKEKAQAFADWWNSWTLADIFAPIVDFAYNCIDSLKGIWQSFKDWIVGLFDFNLFGGFKTPAPEQIKIQTEIIQSSEQGKAASDITSRYASAYGADIKPHAIGGIFSSPHLGLVAEAGREAVIPLENKSRGIPLAMQAAQELGLFNKNSMMTQNVPNIINNFAPKMPDIKIPDFNFVLPEIKAGREAITPLEDKIKGVPFWKAASDELGSKFGNSTTNSTTNNDNSSKSVNLSPVFNFTINNSDTSGGIGIEARLRSIVEQCLSNLQNEWERVSFA